MNDLEERIVEKVRNRLGEARLQGVILYLDPDPKRAGERIPAGDVVIDMPWDGYVAFADLEPKANWGHASAYYAIRAEGEEMIERPSQMPPFLKANTSSFRLLWRGPLAPEWAVVENSPM